MAFDASVRYPRSRIEKLGVKEGDRIGIVAFQDAAFERELAGRGATPVKGRLGENLPMVLCAFRDTDELGRLADLKDKIAPNGCVWALWPKGQRELREDDVRQAAIAAGLVDVKVMAFSDVLSGLKLVIPVADRPPKGKDKADKAPRRKESEVTEVLRKKKSASSPNAKRGKASDGDARGPRPPRRPRRGASGTK